MKRLLLVVSFIVMAAHVSVSSASAEDTPLSKPDVLGEETIYTSKHLASYDTIIIKDFDISKPELDNIDDDEKKDIEPIMSTIPKIMSSYFVNELKSQKKFINVENNSDKKKNAVILEGKVTKLSGGHGAAKFFLGWMTPQSLRTHIEVSGRLIDAQTGKELAVFSDVKSGLTGAGMGYIKEILVNLSGDLGRDMAEFVGKLY
ncbi:DUF4410 domain-containing protein [Geotalea uraniireducens]|uniref:DUF4410 domain-containing protein n=1 Tax=Geotalea uraniireducens (strain Rf4) TaxID=351605 RepID=A5G378_GEOUR|nr:DUF4410 domain-containing protein [Geotalea uraniireducens]ABQ26246.1 hypothetical protein Gura_2056 [Geotalea uraniireducens Rf4]